MTKNLWILIAVLVLFFGLAYSRKALGNSRLYKMLAMLKEGRYSEVEKLATDTSSRLLLSPFSIQQVLLQKAILKKDTEDVNRIVDQMGKLKLNEQMKKEYYLEAFNYYVPVGENEKAKECAAQIQKLNGFDDTKRVVSLIEDVVIEGNTDHLSDLIKQAENADGIEKVGMEGLISKIYHQLGDFKNEEKYTKKAQDDLKRIQDRKGA